MGLAPESFPLVLLWGTNLALPAVLMLALHGAPWRSLETAGQQHAFFGAALGVVLLWQLRADIMPGPELHLLGLTAPALVFGWRLTLLIGLLAASVTVVTAGEPWSLLGIEALVSAAVPVAVTVAFATLVRRLAPPNIFIRCWLIAFIGAMLAAAGTHALRILLVLWLGPEPAGAADYPMILPLLVFPEGFINGAIITAVLVYRPQWMVTLRDEPPPHA